MSQNPTYLAGRETWQAKKAQVIQRIAAQRGYGFIDVHQAFIDMGNPSYVKADQIHPTTASDAPSPNGSALWASVVGACLTLITGNAAAVPTQPPSSLSQGALGLIPNNLFSSWTVTNPDGWTTTNADLSKDTANFETGTYGMKITANADGQASADFIATAASLGITGRIAGRTITLSARIFVPSDYTGTPSIVIKDQTGSVNQRRTDVVSTTRGRFIWLIATKRMNDPLTTLTLTLAVRLSGTQAGSITVDRFNVVEGDLPREAITGTPGPAGAPGAGVAGMADFLSSLGNEPGVIAGTMGAGVGSQSANNANLYRIRPSRDCLITALNWVVHTQAGNYDIGLYSVSGTRLWSKGSTAMPTGFVTETVSPAVSLVAGTEYFVAIVFDGTAGLARGSSVANSALMTSLTGKISALNVGAAFPLPATITPGSTITNRLIPITLRES